MQIYSKFIWSRAAIQAFYNLADGWGQKRQDQFFSNMDHYLTKQKEEDRFSGKFTGKDLVVTENHVQELYDLRFRKKPRLEKPPA